MTVLPDAYLHGERSLSGTAPIDIYESVSRTVHDIGAVIDGYGRENVCIAGYSMGGFIAFAYAVKNPDRIRALASVISSPDWSSVMQTGYAAGYLGQCGIMPGSDKMEEMAGEIRKTEPIANFKAMEGMPLLMINWDEDPVIPISGPRRMYDLLVPYSSGAGDLVLSIYSGTEHSHTHDMDAEMINWIKKYI
jgi:pimeloyl-ACP methyl ester carboxylesterase